MEPAGAHLMKDLIQEAADSITKRKEQSTVPPDVHAGLPYLLNLTYHPEISGIVSPTQSVIDASWPSRDAWAGEMVQCVFPPELGIPPQGHELQQRQLLGHSVDLRQMQVQLQVGSSRYLGHRAIEHFLGGGTGTSAAPIDVEAWRIAQRKSRWADFPGVFSQHLAW